MTQSRRSFVKIAGLGLSGISLEQFVLANGVGNPAVLSASALMAFFDQHVPLKEIDRAVALEYAKSYVTNTERLSGQTNILLSDDHLISFFEDFVLESNFANVLNEPQLALQMHMPSSNVFNFS
jgi:hypothetical protein